ncbi:MAG: tetratricopeptide repeat protein [Verrucomicrobiota bacterium]
MPYSEANSTASRPQLWLNDRLWGVFLIVVTLVVYLPAWNGKPVWDDDVHLTRPALQSLHGLVRIWCDLKATPQYYPLVHSVFWVEHKLWDELFLDYHLVNILLHACSAVLLLKVLQRLEVPGAQFASAIFALHPVNVEAVAWISELKDTLSGVLCLGSVLAYLSFDRGRSRKSYAVALGLFLLGLMSKTVIATLPAALLVVFWWKRGKVGWKKDVLPLGPYFLAGLVAGLFTAWVERKFIGAQGKAYDFSVIERVLVAGRAFWFYLGKLYWPENLIFIYPRWNIDQTIWWQYLFPASALALLAALWRLSRRYRGPLAAFLFYAVTLFPALGFFNVYSFRYSFAANHFLYLAGIGPITLAAAGITGLLDRFKNRQPFPKAGFYGVVLLVLGVLSWRQSGMFVDSETLWRTTINRNPDCGMAYNNLGVLLQQRGQLDEALADFQKAVTLQPDSAEAWTSLGRALFQKGQRDKAVVGLRKALEIRPDYVVGHNNLGCAFFEMGMLDEAIIQFQIAVELQPHDETAQANLGNALMKKGRLDEALLYLQKALEIKPHDLAVMNSLAWILATSPQVPLRNGVKAVELAQAANQLAGGKDPIITGTLAAAYAEAGRLSEAVTTARQALQLATAQTNTAAINDLRAQLGLYQAGLPFRDLSLTNALPAESRP